MVTVMMLALAVTAGVSGTLFTRASQGFTRWRWALLAVASYSVATVLMAWLVQRVPVGVVYAVWTGTAAVVLLTVDRLVWKVRTSGLQLAGMAVTIAGVTLLGTAMP